MVSPIDRASASFSAVSLAKEIKELLEQAALFTASGRGVTRLYLSRAHNRLLEWFAKLAEKYNFDFQIDHVGNARFRLISSRPHAPTLLMGSHQDTVVETGKFEGMIGILLPLVALQHMRDLPFNLEIVGFADEEGVRFGTTLSGVSALAGSFNRSSLQNLDDNGVSMLDAMKAFGLKPEKIAGLSIAKDKLLGFFELAVEQGGVLQSLDIPLGVVSSITGIERHWVKIMGRAGHAGTTPMAARRDALVIAAKIITWVDEFCCKTGQLIGVVGKLDVSPNAVNVVPGEVYLTIELRSPNDDIKFQAREKLHTFLDSLPGVIYGSSYIQSGMDCHPVMIELLSDAVAAAGLVPRVLFSSAVHEGLELAKMTPCGMLFIRTVSATGMARDEVLSENDCAIAVKVVQEFVSLFARRHD